MKITGWRERQCRTMITTAASPSPSAFSATSVTCMTTLTSTLLEKTTMEMKKTKWKARRGNPPEGRRTVIIEQPSSAFCFPWAFWDTSSLDLYEWDLKPSLALDSKDVRQHKSGQEAQIAKGGGATRADKDIKTVYTMGSPTSHPPRTHEHSHRMARPRPPRPTSHGEISQGPLQSQAAFPSTHDDHPMQEIRQKKTLKAVLYHCCIRHVSVERLHKCSH